MGYRDAAAMKEKIAAGTTIVGATAAVSEFGCVTGLVWTEATGASVAGSIASLTGVGLAVLVIGGIYFAHQQKQNQKMQEEMQQMESTGTSCRGSLETDKI